MAQLLDRCERGEGALVRDRVAQPFGRREGTPEVLSGVLGGVSREPWMAQLLDRCERGEGALVSLAGRCRLRLRRRLRLRLRPLLLDGRL